MSTYLALTLYVALASSAVAQIHKNHGVPKSSDSGCNILSEYLVSAGYPSHHVPFHKIKGGNAKLDICRNDEAMQSTCCTNATEINLRKAAVGIFYSALRSTVDHLHLTLSDSSAYYHEEYLSSIEMAANRTKSVLRDIYHLNDDSIHDCIEDLFLDLSNYLRGDDTIDLRDSVLRFYDHIFPVVFQNLLSDPSSVSISPDYRDCLVSCRSNLTSSPFGSVPVDLGMGLARSAHTARQLLTRLITGAEVFHETSIWSVATPCSNSLTQLITCAACWGSTHVAKPCRMLCTKVMEGCLAGIYSIDAQWSQFINGLVELQRQMFYDDLESLLYVVHMNISESILYSMETTHKYYQQIVSQCGRPSSSSMPSDKASEFTSYNNVRDLTTIHSLPGLQSQISAVMTTILTTRGIFQRLPVMICSHEKFLADSETMCWNGTSVASYRPSADLRRIISSNTWPQSSTVKIIAGKLSQSPKPDADKLNKITGVTETSTDVQVQYVEEDDSMLHDENEMMSDEEQNEYWQHGQKHRRYTDDEMSGSGEGSGDYDVPRKKHPGNKKVSLPDFDFADIDSREIGGRVSSPYVTTARPTRPHSGSVHCKSTILPIVMFLSTLLSQTVWLL